MCDLTVSGEFSDFKDGIDTFHRYQEDFLLYKELGFLLFYNFIILKEGLNFNVNLLEFCIF